MLHFSAYPDPILSSTEWKSSHGPYCCLSCGLVDIDDVSRGCSDVKVDQTNGAKSIESQFNKK